MTSVADTTALGSSSSVDTDTDGGLQAIHGAEPVLTAATIGGQLV